MSQLPPNQTRLWALIVAYGVEDEYERDWLGRIKSRRSKHYLKIEATPEFVQLLTSAGEITNSARAGLASAPGRIRRMMSRLSQSTEPG